MAAAGVAVRLVGPAVARGMVVAVVRVATADWVVIWEAVGWGLVAEAILVVAMAPRVEEGILVAGAMAVVKGVVRVAVVRVGVKAAARVAVARVAVWVVLVVAVHMAAALAGSMAG